MFTLLARLSVPVKVVSLTIPNVPVVIAVLISPMVPSPLTSMSRSKRASSVNLESPRTTSALSSSASVTLIPTLFSLLPLPDSVTAEVSVETRRAARTASMLLLFGDTSSFQPTTRASEILFLSRSLYSSSANQSVIERPLMYALPTTSRFARGSVLSGSTNPSR